MRLEARKKRVKETAPGNIQVRLRVVHDMPSRSNARIATHTMPSGMGGTFLVEIMERRGEKAVVRIHMPKTDWHHWRGCFEVDTGILVPIEN